MLPPIVFPTRVRRSYLHTTRGQTMVKLKDVEIGFVGDTIMWVGNEKTGDYYVSEVLNTASRPMRQMKEIDQNGLMFVLNRMLHDQSKDIIEKSVDIAFGGKK